MGGRQETRPVLSAGHGPAACRECPGHHGRSECLQLADPQGGAGGAVLYALLAPGEATTWPQLFKACLEQGLEPQQGAKGTRSATRHGGHRLPVRSGWRKTRSSVGTRYRASAYTASTSTTESAWANSSIVRKACTDCWCFAPTKVTGIIGNLLSETVSSMAAGMLILSASRRNQPLPPLGRWCPGASIVAPIGANLARRLGHGRATGAVRT